MDPNVKNEFFEMFSKSVSKSYSDEDRKKLGLEPTPKREVHSQGPWKLYRYDSSKKSKHPPVLVIPSLINKNYTMDLLPGHSLMEVLVNSGLDVFIIDWGRPDASTGHIGMAHYIGKYLKRAVRQVKSITGAKKISLLGQCLGGTMAALYSAHPELKKDVDRLALLTAPLDFENSGMLSMWTDPASFDVVSLTSAVGPVVPADFFHSSFPLLNVRASLSKYKNLLEKIDIPEFKKIWQALDIWANDNVDFALQAFRDLIKLFYQENRIMREIFELEGEAVGIRNIDMPTLAVAARDDHVFNDNATRGIQKSKAADNGNLSYHVMTAGHVTVIVAHPVRNETFKLFQEFLTR